ncbi:ribosomal-protein-alanine acetyltransferase putative [Roseburia sp. CAG:182]|nr:ribosomal-protein-alanine acetyltransferase putative [Roseburia sp. CAG:182]
MNLIYETDRLILKVLRPEAAKKVLCFYLDNKELFEKYEASRPDNFYTVKYQKSVLLCEYNLTVQLSAVRFYVFLKDDPDRIIGTICFRDITRSIYDSCEVGYKFDERFWHHGYAMEALIEGIDIMFGDLGLHRITACVMPGNTPSIRLLESLYFKCEGLLRQNARIQGEWADHYLYSLIHP